MRVFTSGYSAEEKGSATGIGVLLAGAADEPNAAGPLGFASDAVGVAGSPTWLTKHPRLEVYYAALEFDGTVRAFRRTGEATLEPLGGPVPAGEAACHVAVAPDGASLIVSCWSDGRVVRMAVDADGRPSSPIVALAATDPHAAAALGFGLGVGAADADGAAGAAVEADARVSRAHQARYLPGGVIVTTDMGYDVVRIWRDTPRGLVPRHDVVLPAGSGPRHTVWHPSGHLYVLTELSQEVFVLAPTASGQWTVVSGTPAGAGTLPTDTAAEITLARDGAFVHAGVRGTNTVATLRVRGDGATLEPVALIEAGVDWPRNHVVVRDTLLVAGQRSQEVVSMTIDPRTGVPGRPRHRTAVPTPTCLLPLAD